MSGAFEPGRLLRRAGAPRPVPDYPGIRIDDPAAAAAVLRADAVPLLLYDQAVHAEGPVWQASHDRLLWSDVTNRRLNAWYPDGHVEVVIDATCFINGNALGSDGAVYHCEHGRRCISRSDVDGRTATPLVGSFEGRRLNAPNDIAAGPDGTLWFTDPVFGIVMPAQGVLADPELDHRSLYRFDPRDGSLARMADFDQPNGLAFAPDGRRLYVTDTSYAMGEAPGGTPGPHRTIVAFDVATDGTLSGRREIWTAAKGVPDGLAVDAAGRVWTSAGDGIHLLSADGAPLAFVPMPQVVTNCAFGLDGRRLFVTAGTALLALDLV